MKCYVSAYFWREMKAMSGCEPSHESDMVCIHPVRNFLMERTETSSEGCDDLNVGPVSSVMNVVISIEDSYNVLMYWCLSPL